MIYDCSICTEAVIDPYKKSCIRYDCSKLKFPENPIDLSDKCGMMYKTAHTILTQKSTYESRELALWYLRTFCNKCCKCEVTK